MSNNMKLWDAVSTSNPQYLKQVSFGSRSFTAIDPQYQIMMATEAFGPVGEGWGWDATHDIIHLTNGDIAMISYVTVWHGDRSNEYGPFPGSRKIFDAEKGRFADDAPKMSVTDGLTKCLSHLGFNADVFLGKMDGNKYADQNAKASGVVW